jgi:MarR family transcriptional regulator, organic hydroperoxide resistance regulator
MDFEQSLVSKLSQVGTAHRVLLDKSLQQIGLFAGQVNILIQLWREDGLTQADLSERLGVAAPTISKMVKSLTEAEFVKSEKSKADGRLTMVYLTPIGLTIKEDVEKVWKELETRLTADLTPGERLLLIETIDKINEAMGFPEQEEA